MSIIGFAHVCVDAVDTERSRAFYEKLGAKVIYAIPSNTPEGEEYMCYHVAFDSGSVIEIQRPQTIETGKPFGWGHLCLLTDDIDAAVELVAKSGGRVQRGASAPRQLKHTKGSIPFCNAITFGPDGEKIELFQYL